VSTPNPDTCPRTEDAGAYLLGSLDPAERADFAAHLSHCPYCLREVGQLAGLPGLLARSPGPPSGVRQLPVIPPPVAAPDGEQPGPVVAALRQIHRRRARRRGLLAAAFVLVAAVGVGGTAVTERALARPGTGQVTGVSAAAQLPVQMHPMGAEKDVTAALAVNDKAWGTEVIMRCHYQGGGEHGPPVYALVARTADGASAELARWKAIPDKDVVLATATDLTRQRLTALEVRDSHGDVVLRTDHI
jgi:Putative zinc-finger